MTSPAAASASCTAGSCSPASSSCSCSTTRRSSSKSAGAAASGTGCSPPAANSSARRKGRRSTNGCKPSTSSSATTACGAMAASLAEARRLLLLCSFPRQLCGEAHDLVNLLTQFAVTRLVALHCLEFLGNLVDGVIRIFVLSQRTGCIALHVLAEVVDRQFQAGFGFLQSRNFGPHGEGIIERRLHGLARIRAATGAATG